MRLFLTLILLTVILPCATAVAQNVFALPEKAPSKSGFIVLAPVDPNVSLLYQPVPLDIQNADKSALINKFFLDCTNRNDGGFPPDNQEMLCACMASEIDETLETPQVRNLFEETRNGEIERVDLMVNIYTPCLDIPVYDLMFDRCAENEDIEKYEGFEGKICGCAAEELTKKITHNVDNRFMEGRYKKITDTQPLERMIKGIGYRQLERHAINTCINGHLYKKY